MQWWIAGKSGSDRRAMTWNSYARSFRKTTAGPVKQRIVFFSHNSGWVSAAIVAAHLVLLAACRL